VDEEHQGEIWGSHSVRLQASDKNGIATPEGWTPGCDVIVPPPKTADAADKRAGEGFKTVDWYYSTKSL
jgi:peroxiredoxin 2/4